MNDDYLRDEEARYSNGAPNRDGMPDDLRRLMEQELERRQRLHAQLEHFYSGESISMTALDTEVLQVSWENANLFIPMVLIGKRKRDELGIELGDYVKVEYKGKSLPAVVQRQFKGLGEGTTLSKMVAHVLGATTGDTVKLSNLM